jgi:hypothetical protein
MRSPISWANDDDLNLAEDVASPEIAGLNFFHDSAL